MDELDALRAEAAVLGIKVDGRWGVDRLRDEVSAAQRSEDGEGDDEAEVDDIPTWMDDEPDDEVAEVQVDEEQTAIRAGGHIDRGDGRGWVIEE